MSKRMAVVDGEGNVVNVILVGDDSYDPGDGLTLVEDTGSKTRGNAQPGGQWNGKAFADPDPVVVESTRVEVLRSKILDGTITPEEQNEMLLLLSGGAEPAEEAPEAPTPVDE